MAEPIDPINVDRAQDNAGPTAAVQAVGKANYLGNAEVVSKLIREWLDKCLARRAGQSGPRFAEKEATEAKALAQIFLGQNPNYIPVPAFNAPGAIDEFMRENADVKDTNPELAVANTLLSALVQILQILSKYDGQPEELWGWQITGLIEAYEQLFLGIPLQIDDEA